MFFQRFKRSKEETVSIEEYNKALEEKNAQLDSLKKSIEKTTAENQSIKAQIATLERTKEIALILSSVPFRTAEKKNNAIIDLSNSDLTIEFIKQMYEPLTEKKTTKEDRFGIY